MSVSLAGDPTRTGRPKTEWWWRENELVQRLRDASDKTSSVLGAELSLPSVDWDVPWRAAELISTLTHACLDELRRLPNSAAARAQEVCDLILDLQRLAMDWYLHDTAMRGQRLADCAAGLARLRTLPSSAALADNVCEEVVQRCGFHRAVLSKVESRSWKPLAAGVVVLLAGSAGLFLTLQSELVPPEDTGIVDIRLTAPEGTGYAQLDRWMQKVGAGMGWGKDKLPFPELTKP